MKAFKKALMAFAAVTAVTTAFAVSSFAEEVIEDEAAGTVDVFGATADYDNNTVTITGGLKAFGTGDQVTVLIIEKGADEDDDSTEDVDESVITESEILYINQSAGKGANDVFGAMGIRGTLDKTKTYTVKVGSDTGADILVFDIAYDEEEDVWGDVNADLIVSAADVTKLVRHTSGIEALTYGDEELIARCDINLDNDVTAADVTKLVRHTSGIETIEGMKDTK